MFSTQYTIKCLKLGNSIQYTVHRIQYTYIYRYFDTLYIQMQINIHVKCIHLVVQGFIPVLTVVVYVTMDSQVLILSITFVCTLLGPWCQKDKKVR